MSIENLRCKLWFRAVAGILLSALTAVLLLLILAGIAAAFGVSKTWVKAFNIAIRLLAAGICAYYVADGRRALVCGLVSGIASFIGVFLVFLLFGGTTTVIAGLIDFAFSLAFALVFSIIFANFKKMRYNC